MHLRIASLSCPGLLCARAGYHLGRPSAYVSFSVFRLPTLPSASLTVSFSSHFQLVASHPQLGAPNNDSSKPEAS
eukprot:2285564-Rhodomonas_salina.6